MHASNKKRRIFVGVPFDEEAKRGVEKILKALERKHWPVRWEKTEKLHITVAFLGWVKIEAGIPRLPGLSHQTRRARDDKPALKSLAGLSSAVQRGVVGIRPFELEFKGLGGFPDLVYPRVIWVGLKGDLQSMARLYKEIRNQLENSGFKLEERPFVPHVTLGRVRREANFKMKKEIGRQIDKLRAIDIPQRFRVDRVVVYESQMKREGSVYTEITKVRLG